MSHIRIGALGLLLCFSSCGGKSGQAIHPEGASGIVILPSGFADSFGDLTVHTGIDKQPVGADGKFRVQVLGPGPALVTLTDASGKVVLLGYVDAASSGSAFAGGKGEVSAQQTALALLFYATGVFTVPAVLWGQLRDLIAQSAEVTQLADVVSARVVADTLALADGDQQLVDAAKQAAASLLQATRSGHHPAPGPQPLDSSSTLLLVQPSGEQSGVEVLNADTGVSFSNHIRRRSAAAIYETAVQMDGEPSPMPIPPKAMSFSQSTALSALGTVFGLNPVGTQSPVLEVQPANALHGIVGSITDSLSGNTGFTAAPTPATGSVALAQDGDALKTVYTIVVLGPAFQKRNSLSGFPPFNEPAFFSFTPQWQSALTTLSWEEWLLDIVIPVLGSLPLPEAANIKGVSAAVIQELANVVTNIPDLNASVTNGDFNGATTSLIQTLVDNGTVREEILKTLYAPFTPEVTLEGQLATASESLEGVLGDVSIIELILQAIDTSAVLIASSSNNPGEEWTATVVQKKARLDPQTANVDQNHFTVPLTASPGTPSDPSVPFVYVWSVEGAAGGGLIDPSDDVGQEMMFQSRSNQATYSPSPNASNGQTATVTVQVFTNGGSPGSPMKGTLLGQAQSVITIKFLPCDQALPMSVVSVCGDAVPSMTSVKPGSDLSVAVTLNTGGACGNGASLDLNGTPYTSATLDGVPVQGMTVAIPGTATGSGSVTHSVVFSVSGNALLQCPLSTISDPNQVIPTLSGPWVVLNEGSGGNFDGWSTVHPFVLAE